MSLGHPRVHFRSTTSTNDRARELASAGAPHGTLVTAAEQSQGRGRQGRGWSAPAGRALLCSLVIRGDPALLSLAAGVAVAEVAGPAAAIKWPNDVLVDGRKVAGILVEGRPQEGWAVLGIGLNVAVREHDLPAELRDHAGSLGLEPDAVEAVLAGLLEALEGWLGASAQQIVAAVAARDALLGAPVSWNGGVGRGAGIDGTGRLLVDTGGQLVALDAGEVHLAMR
ncbi:MAG TPA: biotin--[acetyl-CoA-carboxylase] ligase [Solirubrobacteraceae bacterium]|nr:biotin--[acetyl-CoA-carboxylase] ligase [Solirubrobacteraceae bacterium]